MAAPLGAGLVAPDVRAGVGEAGQLAQLGDVAWRLLRLVGARRPLGLVGTDHAKSHAASLVGQPWAAGDRDPPRLARVEERVRVDLVAPADKVALRIVRGGAQDGEPLFGRSSRAALELVQAALGLVGRRALHVAPRQSGGLREQRLEVERDA